MSPIPDSKRLQDVFDRARRWRFYPHPAGDLKDLLALMSVVSGLRQVAAFGFHHLSTEGFARDLKDNVANLGLRTLITERIRPDNTRDLHGIDEAILDVIRKESEERFWRDKTVLLWVFSTAESKDKILEVVKGKASSGILLGYPQCCVEHNTALGREGDQAFFPAIIKAVGNDPEKVLKALREDLKVEIPNCPWESDNAARTDSKFPFLFHIACDACLASDESPSALLNVELQKVAEEIGHGFADAIKRVAKLDSERMQIITECERKGQDANTIDNAAWGRLRGLDAEMEAICAELKKG